MHLVTDNLLTSQPKGRSRTARFSVSLLLLSIPSFAAAQAGAVFSSPVSENPSREIKADVATPRVPLDQSFRFSVGSGHAGLMLRTANLEQLREIQKVIAFRYIRFHGIFDEDMRPVAYRDGVAIYDWSRIDSLYDALLALHIKPIVELSFMPKALASGSTTIFFWNANVTPPLDLNKWSSLVRCFVDHLIGRYGRAEVESWFFEVWNEPNYPGFWPDADQARYFALYDATAPAIKREDERLQVGGPATAGAAWIADFLEHAHSSRVPVDFVSTHTYGVESGFLDADGKADLVLSTDPDAIQGDVRKVHEQILASAYPKLPLLITEWSSSYSSRDPVHDSYTQAAFILEKLKTTAGLTRAMSYWTYSDLFEENGPPPSAFHGGFGLLSRDGIPKCSFFAYKYMAELYPQEIPTNDARATVTEQSGSIRALIWDYSPLAQSSGNKTFYRQLRPSTSSRPATLVLSHLASGTYNVTVHRTGYRANDAYSSYIDLGLPIDLSSKQLHQLKTATADLAEKQTSAVVGTNGTLRISVAMRSNDVVLLAVDRKASNR